MPCWTSCSEPAGPAQTGGDDRVDRRGLAWQVLMAPWMLPETICDFSSDISLSTSTLDFEMYMQRSMRDGRR